MQLKHKKRFVQCMEKRLWLIDRVKSGLQSSMLDNVPQSGRPVDYNQIKTLMENNQCHTM